MADRRRKNGGHQREVTAAAKEVTATDAIVEYSPGPNE